MSGDYSRFTDDPARRRDAVLLQQGRVALDADWNEAAEIADRRLRAVAVDALGRVAVAGGTPGAFRVERAGDDLTLGAGRLWVDGIAAEILPGETFSYLNQPFLRDPPPLPEGEALVWLDVWRREVTWVEDPSLLDVALGGVDTATRLQTVWQVRVEAKAGAECGAEPSETLSAGRLTARALAPPAPDDPCILSPTAGYRGLENRLYRIEIHEGGPAAPARFRWSRDNGSVVGAVVAQAATGSATTLTLDRLGRDRELRFGVGDWIGVADDARELAGLPAAMAQVTGVFEADARLELDRVLPDWLATDADALADRHARVTRWDQAGVLTPLDGDGLIVIGAGPIAIEDGIEVTFGGGGFRTGDHWLFAARVADASIEALTDAPPRGIARHRVQLAALIAGGGVTDCRPAPVAAAACCCVAVAPGESIQQAIDALPPAGGCVCLLPGVHVVDRPVTIARDDITLEAGSGGAIVRMTGDGPALLIGGPDTVVRGVRVARVGFARGQGAGTHGASTLALLLAANARDLVVSDCTVGDGIASLGIGIFLYDCVAARVETCRIAGALAGIVAAGARSSDLAFVDNHVAGAGPGRGAAGVAGPALTGIAVVGDGDRVRVTGNVVTGALIGIAVDEALAGGGVVGDVTVSGNAVTVPEGLDDTAAPVAIGVAAAGARVDGNRVALGSAAKAVAVGIQLSGYDLEADGNVVTSGGGGLAIGIQLGRAAVGKQPPLVALGATIARNSLTGCWIGIAATFAVGAEIAGNRIAGRPGGRADAIATPKAGAQGLAALSAGIALVGTVGADVHDNVITAVATGILGGFGVETRIAANLVTVGIVGVLVAADRTPAITGNIVEAMTAAGVLAFGVLGRLEASRNRVVCCGVEAPIGCGLVAAAVAGELVLHGNDVLDTGIRPDGNTGSTPALALGGIGVLSASVAGNSVSWTKPEARDVKLEDRALMLWGWTGGKPAPPGAATAGAAAALPVVTQGGAVVTGNRLAGPGRSALVEVGSDVADKLNLRFGCVLFADNHIVHTRPGDGKGATVTIRGQAASASGNHVRATGPLPSFDLGASPGPFIGNVATGAVVRAGGAFPAPLAAFNTHVSA